MTFLKTCWSCCGWLGQPPKFVLLSHLFIGGWELKFRVPYSSPSPIKKIFRNQIILCSVAVVSSSATPWAVAHQASLCFTIPGVLKFTSIEIGWWHPTVSFSAALLPSVIPTIRGGQNTVAPVSVLPVPTSHTLPVLACTAHWLQLCPHVEVYLVAARGLHCCAWAPSSGAWASGALAACGLWAIEHRLSASSPRGIFSDQGLNPSSLPLSHQDPCAHFPQHRGGTQEMIGTLRNVFKR